jgi:hypothetical protein
MKRPIALLVGLLSGCTAFAQGFAPPELRGISALGLITSGNGAFAAIGGFRLTLDRTGTGFALAPLTSTVGVWAGGYTYTKTGLNTGVVTLTDVVLRVGIPYAVTFYTPTAATFTVSTVLGNQTGYMLLEINTQAAPAGLSNMSVRAVVPAGGAVIPGLVLDAQTRVLVRVAGPALAAFGVAGTLANPKFVLQSGPLNYAQSDDWSDTAANQAAVQAAGAAVGAFPFAVGSKDAAAVVDLPAGNYTCLITGDAGTSGEILLEVYRVPR